MKVTDDQLDRLASLIYGALADKGFTLATWKGHYITNKIGNDHEQRARWDALYAVPFQLMQPLLDELYAAGCNDNHIDTALRRVFK